MPDQKPTLEYGRPHRRSRADRFAIAMLMGMVVGLILALLMMLASWANDHGYLFRPFTRS